MGDTKPHIKRKDWLRFFLCGLTGIAINQMFFIKGLTYTSAIHVSLLILLTPILITVFAFTVLKEKVTITNAFGLALGIGGAVLLILSKEQSVSASNYLLGDLLIVINDWNREQIVLADDARHFFSIGLRPNDQRRPVIPDVHNDSPSIGNKELAQRDHVHQATRVGVEHIHRLDRLLRATNFADVADRFVCCPRRREWCAPIAASSARC